MKKEKIVIVVRAVFKFDDNYLVLEQENASGNNYLLFPGGHVKRGESLKEAIIREVGEELNICDTNPTKVLFIKETLSPFDRNYEIFFECNTVEKFSKIEVKQKEYTGYEKIKKCLLKSEKDLKYSNNFFPENFLSTDKYQYLELNLDEYTKRFGKDRNIKKLKK